MDLCKLLNLPEKTSSSKVRQLRRLGYICDIQRTAKRTGYFYTTVYADPDSNLLAREKALGKEIMDVLFTQFLYMRDYPLDYHNSNGSQSTKYLLLPRNNFLRMLGFFNDSYRRDNTKNSRMGLLAITHNIPYMQYAAFVDRVKLVSDDVLEAVLDTMVKQKILTYKRVPIIAYRDPAVSNNTSDTQADILYRLPTKTEEARITQYENQALAMCANEKFYQTKNDSFIHTNRYYKALRKIVQEQEGWVTTASGFHLTIKFDHPWFKVHEHWTLEELKENEKRCQEIINAYMVNRIRTNAQTQYANYLRTLKEQLQSMTTEDNTPLPEQTQIYKKKGYYMTEAYLEHQNKLTDLYITSLFEPTTFKPVTDNATSQQIDNNTIDIQLMEDTAC